MSNPDRQTQPDVHRSPQGVQNRSFDENYQVLAVELLAENQSNNPNSLDRLQVDSSGQLKTTSTFAGTVTTAPTFKDDPTASGETPKYGKRNATTLKPQVEAAMQDGVGNSLVSGGGVTPIGALNVIQPQANGSGSVTTASGSAVTVQLFGSNGEGRILITGTWTGTLTFQGSVDGATYVAINADVMPGTGILSTTTTANGTFAVDLSGFQAVRVLGPTSTGSAAVNIIIGAAGSSTRLVQSLPVGTNSIGKISDITTSVVPGAGATNLGKAEDAAHTSGDIGVFELGVRNDSQVDLTSTDLDYSPIAVDSRGNTQVNPYNAKPTAASILNGSRTTAGILITVPANRTWVGTVNLSASTAVGVNTAQTNNTATVTWAPGTGGTATYVAATVDLTTAVVLLTALIGSSDSGVTNAYPVIVYAGTTGGTFTLAFNTSQAAASCSGTLV